ncbi:MAG: hypothetical protein IJ461_10500, partial [Clostridia bacterium]|nr:hypothetical protein [Clostridia bacterium]
MTLMFSLPAFAEADTSWYSQAQTVFTLSSAEDLLGLAQLVNDGNSFAGQTIRLSNDIDLSAVCSSSKRSWPGIGAASAPFTGVFDGDGHTVSNLYVNSSANGVGLFGTMAGGASISNVVVSGSVTTTGGYAGGLVGWIRGGSGTVTLDNCGSLVDVTASGANAAGLIGCNYGSPAPTVKITNSFNAGDIKGGKESAAISGWLGSGAQVTNCWSVGSVVGVSSGCPFARGTTTYADCYQVSSAGAQTGITPFPLSDVGDPVASGEIAYQLGLVDTTAPLWGQTIGQDAVPVIGGQKVYMGYKSNCVTLYANSASGLSATRPAHDASYNQGQCSVCGQRNPSSAYYSGLNMIDVITADASAQGWSWDADTKTLTLDGFETIAKDFGI